MSIKAFRRATQALGVLFIFGVPFLNKKGIDVITGTLYSLSVGPVWITDPVIGVQTLLTTMRMDGTLLISLVMPVLIAVALGRVFCGWFCPQNTLSELTDRLASLVGIRRLFRPAPTPVFRYTILIGVLILTAASKIPLVSLISAPGILSVQAATLVYHGIVGIELGLIGFIILAELFLVRRAWCNHVCPVGSVLGLLRWKRTLRVRFSEEGGRICGKCAVCADVCQLGLNPVAGGLVPQCHNCGDCVDACSAIDKERKPLSFTF
jgi:ferredoxin-type protein NapH